VIGIAIFLIIYPPSTIEQIQKLTTIHLISDIVIIIVVIYIGAYSITIIQKAPSNMENVVILFRPSTCLILFGMGAFSFEGIAVIIPFYKMIKDKRRYFYVYRTTLFVVCSLYCMFAHVSYLAFGNQT